MFNFNSMYLIYESHGEYDDFVKIPLITVNDRYTAALIIEELDKAMETQVGEFYELIKEYGFDNTYDHAFSFEMIWHVDIEWNREEE